MDQQSEFLIQTRGPGLYEMTSDVQRWVSGNGLCTLFIQHTSASLLIQENADPEVRTDLTEWFNRMVPSGAHPSMQWLTHTYEGPDDMPAHIKASLLPVSLSIPIVGGRLALGRWQGIYVMEHRDRPQVRRVVGHIG